MALFRVFVTVLERFIYHNNVVSKAASLAFAPFVRPRYKPCQRLSLPRFLPRCNRSSNVIVFQANHEKTSNSPEPRLEPRTLGFVTVKDGRLN